MPVVTGYDDGVPCWVDLGSRNIEESVRFYGALFGWSHQDTGADTGHYTMFTLNDSTVAAVGGLMMEGQPEVWSTYVKVTDADATAAAVSAAGGSVLAPPMDVMGQGRMAVFMDPTGAAISIWQPENMSGAQLANEPGSLVWNELNTRDVDPSKAFYPKVFGWAAHDNEMEGMTYTEWQVGGRTIAGMLPMPEGIPAQVPNHWLVYFGTDDTDATVAKATELGGSVMAPPFDVPPGRMAVLADPHGAAFAVIKMAG